MQNCKHKHLVYFVCEGLKMYTSYPKTRMINQSNTFWSTTTCKGQGEIRLAYTVHVPDSTVSRMEIINLDDKVQINAYKQHLNTGWLIQYSTYKSRMHP